MPDRKTPRRGDIVVTVFPGNLGKPRPAVVLQADDTIAVSSSILSCPLTTFLIDAPLLRPIVAPTSGNGLSQMSQVMVDKISPVRKDVIRQIVGKLEGADMVRVEIALGYVTGLAMSIQTPAR
jgi:mRNA interferase MazF